MTVTTSIQAALSDIAATTAAFAPRIIGAVLILIVGWIIGRIIGSIVRVFVDRTQIDRVTHNSPVGSLLGGTEHSVSRAFGAVARWFVYGLTVLAAADVLAIAVLSQWLSTAVAYLPSFIGGLAIILFGFLLGDFIADMIRRTEGTTRARYTSWFANGVRVFLYFTVIVIGLDTMGVDVTFLYLITGAIVSGLGLATAIGVGLAVGLGGKEYVADHIEEWMSDTAPAEHE